MGTISRSSSSSINNLEKTVACQFPTLPPELDLIEDLPLRELVEELLNQAMEQKLNTRMSAAVRRMVKQEGTNLSPHSKGTVYFASKLCASRKVESEVRDAILAACILMYMDLESVKQMSSKLTAMSQKILFECSEAVKIKGVGKNFPKDYLVHEQIVLLASIISAEKTAWSMEFRDYMVKFSVAA